MPRVNGMPTEAEEQIKLFQWAAYMERGKYPQLRLLYAVPNGGRRDRIEAAHMKLQGVKAGVPDICLAYPSGKYHALYIELKVGKNKPSDKQKTWLHNLQEAGYMAAVCYGYDDAVETIERYLSL